MNNQKLRDFPRNEEGIKFMVYSWLKKAFKLVLYIGINDRMIMFFRYQIIEWLVVVFLVFIQALSTHFKIVSSLKTIMLILRMKTI